MIITCDECQARFRLADEKLKPGGTKVRCSKCRHVFTVLPPEPEPTEETVDFGAFNMEPVTEEEAAPASPTPPRTPSAPVEVPAAAGGARGLDFSGLEPSLAPASGKQEFGGEFAFVDTTAAAEPPASTKVTPAEPARAFGELDFDGEGLGELDFAAPPAVSAEAPGVVPHAGPAEFAFDEELSADSGGGFQTDEGANVPTFDFAAEPRFSAAEEFQFDEDVAATAAPAIAREAESADGLSEFSFETESGEARSDFGEEAAATEKAAGFDFSTGDSFSSSMFDQEAALGEEGAIAWDQTDKDSGPTFDFDEPNFETRTDGLAAKSRDEAGMSFGEIDFAGGGSGAATGFGAEPGASPVAVALPVESASPQAPPSPRPAPSRPRGEPPLPTPALARKGPLSRVVLILVLLLLALCGAGGYFYFMGDGQQVVNNLLMKIKGEAPVAPVEQRIGLKIAGSSYIDNRDAGQLLVIQGSATNNFTGARSAITVKGLLLDAGGKILQQQTVFCGNYLGDDKLRTLKYTQIEEAMNNQFGDSLANMNVKPGVELRFTIVFRNVPKEMANINVEVVDSKPGGL